ncbi:metallophosphoesterase family protein [Derxia lacustris]|uniref:metallophosphoesterase family protein n=1 Tax=Derxia lacustris TaxID=764842 RepID=UPI000A16CF04|nr:metallophosphoesterase family protein [Derxia lacustris]
MPTLGLISDTHNLIRPEALAALAGCAAIVHAGDICGPEVLAALARIAPVTAVRGNNDRGAWAAAIPEQATLDIAGIRVFAVHDALDERRHPQAAQARVIVTGHSHRPALADDGRVLRINPGSAGPRRFTLPIALALLHIAPGADGPALRVEFVNLAGDAAVPVASR